MQWRKGDRLGPRRFATLDLSSFRPSGAVVQAKIIGIAAGRRTTPSAIKLGGEFGIFQGGQQMASLRSSTRMPSDASTASV